MLPRSFSLHCERIYRRMNYQAENDGDNKFLNTSSSSRSSSSHWSSTKNPRIVRVSRSFGGKDRHSKVATIRGLRDRRIRLSVPTAIQLYDLQERLGLSQPSKAVDWLLDVAKDDIDELPPLPMIPGFTHQPTTDNQFSVPNVFPYHTGPPSLSLYGGGLSAANQTDAPSTYYSLPSFFPPMLSQNTQNMEINDHLRQINFLED